MSIKGGLKQKAEKKKRRAEEERIFNPVLSSNSRR
jgi:hypothetical protein